MQASTLLSFNYNRESCEFKTAWLTGKLSEWQTDGLVEWQTCKCADM
jgi:hypothetical protein